MCQHLQKGTSFTLTLLSTQENVVDPADCESLEIIKFNEKRDELNGKDAARE
jgi:hypothetical protein